MGFCELLTIIFVLLKCFGVVTWSWWIVFLPEIIAVTVYVILLVVTLVYTGVSRRKMRERFKRYHF